MTVTLSAVAEPKLSGRTSTGEPEACNWIPPCFGNTNARFAVSAPNSTPPTVRITLAPWATTSICSPRLPKPKSPLRLPNPPIEACKPATITAMVSPGTVNGTVIELMVIRVSTAFAVSL